MPTVALKGDFGGSLAEFITSPAWPEFIPLYLESVNTDKYAKLLAAVEKTIASGTKKQKGDSLEDLAECFLESIKAFKVEKNLNTKTGELDRYLKVSRIPGTFLDDWPIYVPIECKNWKKPADTREISILHTKAEKMRSSRGFMFSRCGVTGNESTDGWGQIRDLFSSKGYVTLVFDLNDLRKIVDGESPLKMIEQQQSRVCLGLI